MDTVDLKYSASDDPVLNANDLASYLSSIRDVKAYCQGSTLWNNLYRQRLMLSEFRILDGIQRLVEGRCPSILLLDEANLDDPDWFTRLVLNVRGLVQCGVAVRVNSKDYVSLGTAASVTFTDTPEEVRDRKRLSPRTVDSFTISYTRRILHAWFGGCSSFAAQARASLVRLFMDRLGSGSLLLPEVWDIYDELPQWVFTKSCPRFIDANMTNAKFVSSYLDDFDLLLLQATLCDPSILARTDELQTKYLDMYTSARSYVESVTAARSKGTQLKKLLASMTSDIHARRLAKQAQQKKQLATTASASTARLPLTVAGTGTSRPPSPPPEDPAVSTCSSDPVSFVVKFLADAHYVALLGGSDGASTTSMTKAQRALYSQGDFLLPIRELAPSRAIMNTGLDQSFAETRAGLFSLQLFRFIHFNSVAFRDCSATLRKVKFENLAEYEAYLHAVRLEFPNAEPSCFCNSRAHGNPVAERTIDRYSDYWLVSRRDDLTWPPNRNFATTYAFYNTYNPTVVRDGETIRLWAGVGPLTRYLFVADLYAAGLLDAPTVADIAAVAAALRKGAMRGLNLTGFLPDGGTGMRAREAFHAFYAAVSDALSAEQVVNFQWNPITAEHTLCKLSRMHAKKLYW